MTRTVRAAGLTVALLLAGCADNDPGPIAVSGGELPVSGAATLKALLPSDEGEPTATDLTYKIELTSPMDLEMSVAGYDILPAGTEQSRSGHFHLQWRELDPDEDASRAESVCTAVGDVIGTGDTIIHFDEGESEATLELNPGIYRLCLQLGDLEHVALDPRQEYTVVVVDGANTPAATTDDSGTTTVPTTGDTTTTTTTEAPTTTGAPTTTVG